MTRTPTALALAAALAAAAGLARPAGAAAADPVCTQAHDKIAKIYDFVPANVDDATRTRKSAEMTTFWKWIEQTPAAAACLPAELARRDANGFFLFDAAQLLEKVSTRPADRQAAASAVARADLDSVVPYDYVDFGRKLACSGADTTAIARTLLARPSYDIEAFRAPHIVKLARWESLLFLLAPLSSAQLAPALSEWLTQRKFAAAQLELITVAAMLFDGDVQQILARVAAAKSTTAEEKKALTNFLALEKKKGTRPKLTRADFQARLDKTRRDGRFELASAAELDDLKELVQAGDLPQLKDAAHALLCGHNLNQHALEGYGPLGELMQVALSEKSKR